MNDKSNLNAIPIPKIKLEYPLATDDPTLITAEALQKELYAIGLNCGYTRIDRLETYIKETIATLPDGTLEGYKIFNTNAGEIKDYLKSGGLRKSFSDVVTDTSIHANWQPQDMCPYRTELAVIAFPEHFDYLRNNYINFASSIKDINTYEGDESTVNTIKKLFVEIALNMSSVSVKGLNKELMEAALTNIIAPVPEDVSDYDSGIQNRTIFIVDGYDEKNNECNAVGFINVEYKLFIVQYKEKKENPHPHYKLDITIRANFYNDINELLAEYDYVLAAFKDKLFFKNSIPFSTEITVYDEKPPAIKDTFIHSMPLAQEQSDKIRAIVLYTPDLENIGCINNDGSNCSASYSKSTTSGFTFSTTQKIGVNAKFDASIIVAKAELSVNFEISFTEQWNESQTETISYTVPANSKAFLYQGYICCSILEFDVKTMTYSYKDEGRFLTNVIASSPTPITKSPAVIQRPLKAAGEPLLWETL